MPQQSNWFPLRGILGTSFVSGFSAVNGTDFYNASDDLGKLFLMGSIGGAMVGTLLPFFKNDGQRIGWDVWDLSNTSFAEAPYTYTIKNGLNVGVDMATTVGGVAAGYGLYQLGQVTVNAPLPEILYGASLWSAVSVSVVYGGTAVIENRHKIYDFLEKHCCCTSVDGALSAVGGQNDTVRQALLETDRLGIQSDPTSENLHLDSSKV